MDKILVEKDITLSNLQARYPQSYIDVTEVDIVLTHDFLCNLESLNLERHLPKSNNVIEYSSNKEGKHSTSKPILPKAKQLTIINIREMENIFVSTLTPIVMPKGSFEKP